MSLFGWWKPRCPVGYREKAWVETRMRWLGEQFGTRRLTECKMVLPTEECFSDPYDETPEAARRLLDRVSRYMDANPAELELQVLPKDAMPGAVGNHEPGVIRVADTQLADPIALVATLAHELSHHALMQRKLLDDETDREWTTDLTTVLFGLGIFVANATVFEKHERMGRSSWWSPGRQGCLPARATAYAMSLHAWLRGEQRPDWTRHLRQDVAETFDEALRYLEQTEDSMLRPDNLHNWDKNPPVHRLLDSLARGTASERVAALWELGRRGAAASEAAPAVAECLSDRRPGIRAEAARTLAEFGPLAEMAIPLLVDAMGDHEEEVRMATAYAAGNLRLRPDIVVADLADRLDDISTLDTAAWALAQFGNAAEPALPRLLSRLKGELGRGDGAIDFLVYAVRAISSDPEAELRQLIDSCDSELRRQASELLPEGGPPPSPPGRYGLWYWTNTSS